MRARSLQAQSEHNSQHIDTPWNLRQHSLANISSVKISFVNFSSVDTVSVNASSSTHTQTTEGPSVSADV